MFSNIRWVLFDAVGTLLYADPPVAEVYHAAAQRFGSRLGVSEIRLRFGRALAAEQRGGPTDESQERDRWRRIVKAVIDDVNDSSGELFEQLWWHFAQPQHWRLFDDVPAALAELASRGCRLGIASNFDRRLYEIISGHSSLATCEAIFVSSEVGFTKPHPRFFAAVVERLGIPPDQLLLIGDDNVNDVAPAHAAGWQAVLLDRDGALSGAGVIHALAAVAGTVSQVGPLGI